jgi:hypothetical protein
MTPAALAARLREMAALEQRLLAATDGSNELGIAINEAFEIASYITDDGDPAESIDAAIALCLQVMPNCGLMIGRGRTRLSEPMWGVQIFPRDLYDVRGQPVEPIGEAESDSAPLAICLALTRSAIRAAKEGGA